MKIKFDLGDKKNSIFIAFILSIIGSISLFVIKKIISKELSNKWLLIPIIINIVSLFLIIIGLKYSSVTIFNVEWNLISSILVTVIGLLYENEIHSIYEIAGLIIAFVAIFIMNIEHIQEIYRNGKS